MKGYLITLFFCLICPPASAQLGSSNSAGGQLLESPDFLPVTQAFQPGLYREGGQWIMNWNLEPGYYLYREQFDFASAAAPQLPARFPAGLTKYDEFFDRDLEVYYDQLKFELGLPTTTEEFLLYVRFQGCADAGYCYPPEWIALKVFPDNGSAGDLGLVAGPFALDQMDAAAQSSEAERSLPPATLLIGFALGVMALTWVALQSIRKDSRR